MGVIGNNGRPYSTVNPDRYNTPAPLPGQSTSLSPPAGRKKVQLSDAPVIGGGAGGFANSAASRHSRYGDEEAFGQGGDAEMSLLGPPGSGVAGRHAGDRFSVGGFNPEILDDDDNAIRCVLLRLLAVGLMRSRYGRIPQRVPRRYKTKKRYELFHGNLVIDNEVPSKLLDMCPQKTEREFKFMRCVLDQ